MTLDAAQNLARAGTLKTRQGYPVAKVRINGDYHPSEGVVTVEDKYGCTWATRLEELTGA